MDDTKKNIKTTNGDDFGGTIVGKFDFRKNYRNLIPRRTPQQLYVCDITNKIRRIWNFNGSSW